MGHFSTARAFMAGLLMLAVAACGGGDSEPAPTATATAAVPTSTPTVPLPTATPDPEEEVLAAYLGYWQLYAEAVLILDESVLIGAASDDEIEQVRDEIQKLRSQGVALRVVIEHRPVILELADTSAIVLDEMTNNSFYVDPETLEPPEGEGSGETLIDTFFLEKEGGRWIVIRSIRQN